VRYEGLEADALALRWRVPRVVLMATTSSTLDEIHALAEAGAESGTLALAEAQTAGRGRQGRTWLSPAGGIFLGLLLRPRTAPRGGALAIRAGLAAVASLAAADHAIAPRLKWPNDLIARDLKVGGILCEARWSGDALGWVAVGVGLNVKGPVPREVAARAVALSDIAPEVGRLAVLDQLVPRLMRLETGAAELQAAERAAFLSVAWHPVPGERVEDLAADGTLVVRKGDGSLDRRTEPA
jgi:biotin-[acetyl-CoA-carboxylase] ligase BirA-like protein